MKRIDFTEYLNQLLKPQAFKDYGPNGLQIEGHSEINHVAFAVSATRDSAEKAVACGADTLIVHHGLFWRFHGARALVGPFAKRVFPLVKAGVNLYGFHLPLDANMEVGHAKSLADLVGLKNLAPFGDHEGSPTGVWGTLSQETTETELHAKLESVLGHTVIYSKAYDRTHDIKTVGIITGGANSDWKVAHTMKLDAYITGEMSEHDWHESAEAGVSMFAGGHHATERLGILALKKRIDSDLKLKTTFIDSCNPA